MWREKSSAESWPRPKTEDRGPTAWAELLRAVGAVANFQLPTSNKFAVGRSELDVGRWTDGGTMTALTCLKLLRSSVLRPPPSGIYPTTETTPERVMLAPRGTSVSSSCESAQAPPGKDKPYAGTKNAGTGSRRSSAREISLHPSRGIRARRNSSHPRGKTWSALHQATHRHRAVQHPPRWSEITPAGPGQGVGANASAGGQGSGHKYSRRETR